MTNLDEISVFYPKLFSELTECPILPFLIHMVSPCKQGHNSNFYLKINGKALWLWRKINYSFQHASGMLAETMLRIKRVLQQTCWEADHNKSASLFEAARDRKGKKETKNKSRNLIQHIAIFPTEVHLHPFHALENHRSKEAKLTNKQSATIHRGRAVLYKKMDNALSETSKTT